MKLSECWHARGRVKKKHILAECEKTHPSTPLQTHQVQLRRGNFPCAYDAQHTAGVSQCTLEKVFLTALHTLCVYNVSSLIKM